jgi:hypothetical protein
MTTYTREDFILKYKYSPAEVFQLDKHLTLQCRQEAEALPEGKAVHKAYYGTAKWQGKELAYILEVANWINPTGRFKSLVMKVMTFATELERDEYIAKVYYKI